MSVVTKFPPGPTYKMPGKLLRQFIHDPINTLSTIAREYGDISYFKLGPEHVYLINNPDYIEKVLIYDHRNFKKGKIEDNKRSLTMIRDMMTICSPD